MQIKTLVLVGTAACSLFSPVNPAFAQGTTAFTYQGRLNAPGGPATGSYDMAFAVWDANVAGDRIAGPLTNTAVAVSNGLFTVTLDFGAGVFTGTNYWVEMAVCTNGAGTFGTLVPRQQLTPAPYALSLVSPQATALNPAGAIVAFAGPTNNVPNGYILCDGRAVNRVAYATLFAAIGTAWGTGDGSSTFNLPDCRGEFLRGVDNGAGRDPDVNLRSSAGSHGQNDVGSYQGDQFRSHTHPLLNAPSVSFYVSSGGEGFSSGSQYDGPNQTPSIGAAGGNETRPVNVYVNYIIKY